MNRLRILSLLITTLLLSACPLFKKGEVSYQEVAIESRAADFKVPKVIFDEIEAEIVKESPNLQPVYLFSPIQVTLESQSRGVVKGDAVHVTFPNGGGQLDLKDYVLGSGTFSISFPSIQFESLPQLIGLYFLSDSPQRKIEDEVFGLGCGQFVNIKDQFASLQNEGFLKLNTTSLRYLYVVSGIFMFVFRDRNQVHLSHVHVTDSRYPDFFCSSLYKP